MKLRQMAGRRSRAASPKNGYPDSSCGMREAASCLAVDGEVTSAAMWHLDQAAATDALFGQQPAELPGCKVASHGAEKRGVHAERGKIASHVGGAAGHEALALEIQHRDRRFGRDARHATPDELIEHHVADYEETRPDGGGMKLAGAARGESGLAHGVQVKKPASGLVTVASACGAARPISNAARPASTAALKVSAMHVKYSVTHLLRLCLLFKNRDDPLLWN